LRATLPMSSPTRSNLDPTDGQRVDSNSVATVASLHWSASAGLSSVTEKVVVEAPLSIDLAYRRSGLLVRKTLGITMRSPGHDEELAYGFLLAEGLIESATDVIGSRAESENTRGEKIATWLLELAKPPRDDLQALTRGFVTTSACGLCGKPTLSTLPLRTISDREGENPISGETITALPERLREQQLDFFVTGGCHGAALCEKTGYVRLSREDVGRHNAVDKLIGAALLEKFDSGQAILVLSGRASFELLQKASAAGIGVVVAVGAPSSAAVDLAHAAGVTLIGFARDRRFNVYTHAGRVALK
jgi:FdhD protein